MYHSFSLLLYAYKISWFIVFVLGINLKFDSVLDDQNTYVFNFDKFEFCFIFNKAAPSSKKQ